MIAADGLDGFNAAGFRCKSLAVCGVSQQCIYYQVFLGALQADEVTYSDGDMLADGQAVQIRIAGGAKSECSGAAVSIDAAESIVVTYDGGQSLTVYFPAYQGTELTLYVGNDGSTWYDAALTELAQSPLIGL